MHSADRHVYDRVLRLRHVHLSGWQREVLTWGSLVLSVLLALTGLVSPWGILLLPAALAVVVKGHDLLLGRLPMAAQRFVPTEMQAHGLGDGRNDTGRFDTGRFEAGRNSNEPPVGWTGGS